MKRLTTSLTSFLVWAFVTNVAMPQTPGGAVRSTAQGSAQLDMLVFAPHPDDEVLGCAGVMLQAIEQGKRIGIVVITSGDGFPKAASVISKKPQDQLTTADFLKLGATRQQQSIDGVAHIGVPTANLMFLGYPDAGLKQVYATEGSVPFRQKFTQKNETYGVVVRDYHSVVHGCPAPYVRNSVVGDIVEIIKTSQPKEIYITTETDTHGDHQAAFWFVRDAAKAADFQGTLFTYIVHGRTLPKLPARRVPLTTVQVEKKRAAIREHQIPTVHDTLTSYAKPEEVFWPIRQ